MKILEWIIQLLNSHKLDWIIINTIDNPGWNVDIKLNIIYDSIDYKDLEDHGEKDWIAIHFISKNNIIQGFGDQQKLCKIIQIIQQRIEKNTMILEEEPILQWIMNLFLVFGRLKLLSFELI